MTPDDRVRYVCRRVAQRIQAAAPAGLGTWNPAWEIVAGPSDQFLDALGDYRIADTPATRQKLQAAADQLVRTWNRAGHEWSRADGPGAHHHPNPQATA